jgi:predicted ArsR family transcriptional regulator
VSQPALFALPEPTDRYAAILRVLAGERALTAEEIAVQADLPVSAVRGLLREMKELGSVERVEFALPLWDEPKWGWMAAGLRLVGP